MGRPTGGWQLRRRRGRPWSVRFTVAGVQVELGTGERDRERAGTVAAELYADAVRGARRKPRRASTRGEPLEEVAAEWLTSVAPLLDPETRATYALYAGTHWASAWATVEAISEQSAADYARGRLRVVSASTVRKELSALRGLLRWCVEQGRLVEAPALPSVPKRALGARHRQGRRPSQVELAPADVRRLLRALPLRTASGVPVRARYTVAYETALRPATLDALSVPEHWQHGAWELRLPPETDKAREGRVLPLTPAARRALASVAPQAGLVFGRHDLRPYWREATDAAGVPAATPYDLRRARITHWLEKGGNMPGVQYLAGHRRTETTARYVQPSLRAARDVIR